MDNEDLELPFQRECRSIFKRLHYRPHTIYHRNRYPLIGDWNAWQRLYDYFEIIKLQGKIPEQPEDERTEHILDVILYQRNKLSNINLVETDMYTIVLVDPLSPMSVDDELSWITSLERINGSIFFVNYMTKSIDEEASDGQNINDQDSSTSPIQPGCFQPASRNRSSVAHLIKDGNNRSNGVDVLSVIFSDIKDSLSEYQERNVQKMMQDHGALVYNQDLKRNDPPDGYYLCNTNCLKQLKASFRNIPHTLATTDISNSEPCSDKYILLAVEVKLSFDALQEKLDKKQYYIFEPAPHPIRHLVIMNGGEAALTWLYFINLAHVDNTNWQTRIDGNIHQRSYECARRLRQGHTHVIYIPSFSSETFRQERLTKIRLDFLCKLVTLEQKIKPCAKSIAGVCGSEKKTLDEVREKKRWSYTKKMIKLIDQFMKKNPIRKQRSSMNTSILMNTNMHDDGNFPFLEQLAFSLAKEMYNNVNRANRKIRLPRQLIERAQELRQIRPVDIVEIPIVRTPQAIPVEDDSVDDTPLGDQPI